MRLKGLMGLMLTGGQGDRWKGRRIDGIDEIDGIEEDKEKRGQGDMGTGRRIDTEIKHKIKFK